jgi:hypothetical protein
MRSQLHFVLWKKLSDVGLLFAVTDDLLSHMNCTDLMFIVPARNSVPSSALVDTHPPSSDW